MVSRAALPEYKVSELCSANKRFQNKKKQSHRKMTGLDSFIVGKAIEAFQRVHQAEIS
ncbi:hypothetical protein BDV26DRAFT_258874 [Aspergillus bertholletiae]|uniref:Uncharacterized protein n=1 Tax=Aspergillus bertholletiae TaxID=1226010 RepID=A0A5N7BCZ1_9EURO|nr:hypothetical protein BDV26DRAFT_258874 [Aspergillus bertholletiae]